MYFEFKPLRRLFFENIYKSLAAKLSLIEFFVLFIRNLNYF